MRGFTLIELIACLLIIAVVAALAGPRFVGTQPFDERGYADELAAALRYAEGVAVATGCNVSFTVTAAGSAAGYAALQQQPVGPGNSCAAAGPYTQPVLRADGTPLTGAPPADANVAAGGTLIFGTAGQVVSAPVPSFSVGPFTLTVDPSSGFVTDP
ncbi:MAG: pilus assembly FimT family protein [Steroidobacteraceae bacterium]